MISPNLIIGIFIGIFIIGSIAFFIPKGESIPPTNSFSNVMMDGARYDAKSYDSSIILDSNYFETTEASNGVYLDLATLPYAQISDLTTQSCPVTITNITMSTNDRIYGITHEEGSEEIRIDREGVYTILAAPQIGEATVQADGEHNMWISLNNEQVENTNIKTSIVPLLSGTETTVNILNWVSWLAQDDIIVFQHVCTDEDIGIIYTNETGFPDTPSIIVSISQVG